MTAFSLVVLVAAVWFVSNRSSRPAVDLRPSVAVLGFKNLGQPKDAWLSTALAELLSTELAATRALRLIPGENIAKMKQEVALPDTLLARDTLERIRRYLGNNYVVHGSYLVLEQEGGRQLRLMLRLQGTQDGEAILVPATGAESKLFELVSQAGHELREKLGLKDISQEEAKAVQATLSSNPEATRLYSEGLSKLRHYNALEARDLLERTIEIDPGYAFAHAALSRAWLDLGYDKKAQASAQRAFELAADLPREDYLSLRGRFYEASAAWDEAVQTYRSLWDVFPDNVDYGVRLAHAQSRAARAEEALETVVMLRELPSPASDDPRIDLAEGGAYFLLSRPRDYLAAYGPGTDAGRRWHSTSWRRCDWIRDASPRRGIWRGSPRC